MRIVASAIGDSCIKVYAPSRMEDALTLVLPRGYEIFSGTKGGKLVVTECCLSYIFFNVASALTERVGKTLKKF